MAREAIYRHLEGKEAAHIEILQEWVRQPSVSTEPDGGVGAFAELLVRRYRELGCELAEVVDAGDPWPGVCAFYDAGADLTIASYAYYDTYGVDESAWTHPPYGGIVTDSLAEQALVDGLIAKRGDRAWNTFLPVTGGVERFARDLDGEELFREYLYGPSINVSEIHTSDRDLPVHLTMLLPDGARAGVELRTGWSCAWSPRWERMRSSIACARTSMSGASRMSGWCPTAGGTAVRQCPTVSRCGQ